MASRAILSSRRYLSRHLNVPGRSCWICSSLYNSDARALHQFPEHRSVDTESRSEREGVFISKENLRGLSDIGFFKLPSHGISVISGNYWRTEIVLPLGVRGLTPSVRAASTATARQPEMDDGNEDNEDPEHKHRKEASAEECDQAVEGLSTAKAKAKAKQLQESQRTAQTIIKKIWAKLLGVGPALRAVASMSSADWAIKFRHWKDEFVSALQHYWLGLKLLWADIRISSRLLVKLAGGKNISRRERQQLTRTTADIFRLVPFAVFILVPFMEFLLPVFLKLFPNMLPSTFQDKMKEQEALKRRLKARIEYAKFLQDTVKEMAKEIKNSHSGEIKQTAEDLDEFLNKVRTGARVSNDEILSFAKLFNDELTLDNISRPRLVNMCKYMGIPPYGTDNYLRFMLRRKLRW
nr:mitochondrial proton/calcium exchanger protein [Elaeis guineensis]